MSFIRLCFDILMVTARLHCSVVATRNFSVLSFRIKKRHFLWCKCDKILMSKRLPIESSFCCDFTWRNSCGQCNFRWKSKQRVRTWSQLFSGNYRKKRIEMKRVRIKNRTENYSQRLNFINFAFWRHITRSFCRLKTIVLPGAG